MSVIFSNFQDILKAFANIIKYLFKGWSIRKAINLSNLLKLAFIYIVTLLWVIFIDFDYSNNFWKKAINGSFSERRFSFYSVQHRIGEGLLYERIKQYAENNSYDYTGSRFSEILSYYAVTAHFYKVASSILNYILKPNFSLALTHHVNIIPKYSYNITYLNMPNDSLYNSSGNFLKKWEHLNEYDAYGDLYSLSNSRNELLEKIAKNKAIIPIYLAQSQSEYQKLAFHKALITGSMWGCARNSLRVKLAIKRLADEDLMDAMGLIEFSYLGEHYKGKLENYGKVINSIIEQTQKYGISLIIHNQEHMLDGIPTSRIAESASSSSIIISDRNKFLEKYFADSVLFIDLNQDEYALYKQIKDHILWIKSHPEESLEMTRKAFDIFNDNFTIEKQLEKLFFFIMQN